MGYWAWGIGYSADLVCVIEAPLTEVQVSAWRQDIAGLAPSCAPLKAASLSPPIGRLIRAVFLAWRVPRILFDGEGCVAMSTLRVDTVRDNTRHSAESSSVLVASSLRIPPSNIS